MSIAHFLRNSRFRYRYKQIEDQLNRLVRKNQKIRCPICGGSSFAEVYQQKPYWIERCTSCGHGLTHPLRSKVRQEDDHINLYSAGEYVNNYLANYAPFVGRSNLRGLEQLKKYVEPGATGLDIGCGFGYFLNQAREAGYEVQGIELSPKLAQEGRMRFGITIHQASVTDFSSDELFDFVTVWDVLEHLVDTDLVLQRIFSFLKPGGSLLIRVPDFSFMGSDLPAEFIQNYLKVVFPTSINQHYHHFSAESIAIILGRNGFEILDMWQSKDDEYTPRSHPSYAEIIEQMYLRNIACEMNIIARRKNGNE